jgi:thiopeptide-type bacteriocin biosynthesis protein
VIDTYKREIERYGANFIEDSETLFYNDSVAVMNVLDSIDGEAGDQIRWWAACKSVDSLLDDFNLKMAEKQLLLQSLSQLFFREFAPGDPKSAKKLKVSLSNKYRVHAPDIENVLNNKQLLDSFLFDVFEERSRSNKRTVVEILNKMELGHNGMAALIEFLKSHIHMNLNRLFISQRRKHEMVLYHYLNEYYRSQIAIQKAKSKVNQNV